MNGLNYLLQTNLYLVLFMGFYALVLRNETFFRHNRIYLNASILLSFAIPFINSPWFNDMFITQKVRAATEAPAQLIYDVIVVSSNEEASHWTMADIIFWIYISGAILLLARFLVQLIRLNSNLKLKKGSAFSFFRILVVDHELPQAETIINHEKVHIRQWHSADIILIEIAAIINWFNPIAHLYKKEIRHIHEFIADEETVFVLQSKSDYALLLFSNTLGIDPHQLSNSFFNNSLLKRRIIMLNKNKSGRTGLWKYGFSAPLFALMLIVSAASVATEKSDLIAQAEKLISPVTEISRQDNLLISKPNTENSAISNEEIRSQSKKGSLISSIPVGIPAAGESSQETYAALKNHIQKNIKYPASARQNNITGYVMVNFKIQNQKVTNAEIAKSLQNDIDNEVLRTFNLFTEGIPAEDNNYSMAIGFQLTGIASKTAVLPATGKNYFVGSIVVTGYKSVDKSDAASKNYQLSEVVIKDFASVEVLPEFPGGMKGWGEYLQKTLKYPAEARKNNITGRVILSFVVLKDGSITGIKILRGIGGGADEEAVRVVKQSPNWIPGEQNGRPVNVAYTMPIFFQLAAKTTN